MKQQRYPKNKPDIIKASNIFRLGFISAPRVKTMVNPTPAFANSPPRHAPNEILPAINNCEITIDEAQFGIRPTRTENNGDRYAFDFKNALNVSSPIKWIISEKTTLNVNTIANALTE